MSTKPYASADIRGSEKYSNIYGKVLFYKTNYGVIVATEINGLPTNEEICKEPIFAFHIHEGDHCTGNINDPFANVMSHYNPKNCIHPYHAGDMPPLFGNNGYAFSMFLTNRFSIDEIIGKAVIIHDRPDDFTTQPSGNAGNKIACGIIKRV